jgi:hypothetical protein
VAAQPDEICSQVGGSYDGDVCLISPDATINLSFPVEVVEQGGPAQAYSMTLQNAVDAYNAAYIELGFQATPFNWSLESGYDVIAFSDDIVTVVFSFWTFTGESEGSISYKMVTAATDGSGTVYTFADMFQTSPAALDALASAVREAVAEELSQRTEQAYTAADLARIITSDPANFQNVVLSPSVASFYYGSGEVAPDDVGPIEVSFRLRDLAPVMQPAFIPAHITEANNALPSDAIPNGTTTTETRPITVLAGDHLAQIVRREYGISDYGEIQRLINEIIAINGLANANVVMPGQTLLIPLR